MTVESPAPITKAGSVPEARLEPNAIGVAQDTVIGMASAAPAATLGLILAALAAATFYASGPALILIALPMIVIANCYRRLNMWNANCGASFEWVGRVINPYLGFMTGWIMITGNTLATVGTTVVLGPSVLAVFGSTAAASTTPNLIISTVVILGMLVIAVLGHRHGTFPITREWWSLSGIGGHGSLAAGCLVAVYAYVGWDGTIYVNEEVKHRRANPGRAAMMSVALLAVIYTLVQVGLQGMVSPAQLQAHSTDALVYTAQALAGSGWAKTMAFAIALSVIATTGVTIVLTARIIYGMASHRVLPPVLGNVNRRFSTPVGATVVVGLTLLGITWAYLLFTSLANAFSDVIAVSSLLFATFYILTAVTATTYYWRRVFSNVLDAVNLGLLPLASAGFLGWVVVKTLLAAPPPQLWSLVGIVSLGLILIPIVRFVLRPQYFQFRPETENRAR